ncbi:MAG: MBL fold metallo-hydrolase, partial [Calditrichia bacterium]|nr:MBL fold metallo-hydrolase [Calditrichia bacterium]
MKFFLLPVLFVFLTASTFTFGQDEQQKIQINTDLFAENIQDSVFVITHYFPWDANSLLIILPGSRAVLIDTPNETTGAEALLSWMYNKFGKIKLTVINTGFHVDNLGGNQYFLKRNIPVYGADLTAKLVKEQGRLHKELVLNWTSVPKKNKKFHNAYKKMEFKPPNNTYKIKEGLKLKIADEEFEIYFPGESHTIDNVVVYLKKRKILFGGCMIHSLKRTKPGYTGDANMEEWP